MLDLCGADHAMMHIKDPLAVENQRTEQDVFPAALTRLIQICCYSLTAKRSMYTTQHEHLGLQHGSKALIFFLVSFIIFCFVHLIQLYHVMVKHFPFFIYNYMTEFQVYIHCFVLLPLMERKVKNIHSLFCLTPTDRGKKCQKFTFIVSSYPH